MNKNSKSGAKHVVATRYHPLLRCYCNNFLYYIEFVMLNIYIYSSCLNVS